MRKAKHLVKIYLQGHFKGRTEEIYQTEVRANLFLLRFMILMRSVWITIDLQAIENEKKK